MPRIVAQSRLYYFFLIHCVLCELNAMRWKLRPRSEQGMSSSRRRSLSRGSTIRFRNEQTIWIPIYGRGSDGWDFPRRGFMRKIHFCSDFSLFSWDFDLILTCGGMNEKVVIQMIESPHMTCGSQVMKCTILTYLHTGHDIMIKLDYFLATTRTTLSHSMSRPLVWSSSLLKLLKEVSERLVDVTGDRKPGSFHG